MEDKKNFEYKQNALASKVIIPKDTEMYHPEDDDLILSLDIQYQDDMAFVAGDLMEYNGTELGTYVGKTAVNIPYHPGLFCFREGPPLFHFVTYLMNQKNIKLNLIIVDGHGIAHPRRFGVACWLGLIMKLPCIGFAKDSLVPYSGVINKTKGSFIEIKVEDELRGFALRTSEGVKPVFVSPGHLVSINTSKKVIENLKGEYRIPDTLRRSDQSARAYSKGESFEEKYNLGNIPTNEINPDFIL